MKLQRFSITVPSAHTTPKEVPDRLAEMTLSSQAGNDILARYRTQSEGVRMSPRVHASDELIAAVDNFIAQDRIFGEALAREPTLAGLVRGALIRFGYDATRIGVAIGTDGDRRDAFRMLASEFIGNAQTFGEKGSIALRTVRHGSLTDIVNEPEFAWYADAPYLVTAAVTLRTDPRATLRRWKIEFDTIRAEPEFASYSDIPGAVRTAVMRTTDGRTLLRHWSAEMESILADPEFADYVETPGTVRKAVIGYADARKPLRRWAAEARTILAEPEFEAYRDTPSAVGVAVSGYADPRGRLRHWNAEVAKILTEPEFASFIEVPGEVRKAVFGHSDGRATLRRWSSEFTAILAEPEFADYTDKESMVRDAIIRFTDARGALRRWRTEAETLLTEPEFATFLDTPWTVRAAVMKNVDPRLTLRRWDAEVQRILTEPEFETYVDTPAMVLKAVVMYSDPRETLRRWNTQTEGILNDPEFSPFANNRSAVRKMIISHGDAKELFREVLTDTKAILVAGLDAYRTTFCDGNYRKLCGDFSGAALRETEAELIPGGKTKLDLAVTGVGGFYEALRIYHREKGQSFPYTRVCFLGPLASRERRLAGQFTPYDIRMMRAEDGDIDATIFGLRRCESVDKQDIRVIITEQVIAAFRDRPVAYVGLETAHFDSLRMLHDYTNVDLGRSKVIEFDKRTYEAMLSLRGALRNGASKEFGRLSIEHDDVTERVHSLTGRYEVVNLDFWGQMSPGKESTISAFFDRKLVAHEALVYVTIGNAPLAVTRAARAGYTTQDVDRIVRGAATRNGYEVRSGEGLPYQGGLAGDKGTEMMFFAYHVVRSNLQRLMTVHLN